MSRLPALCVAALLLPASVSAETAYEQLRQAVPGQAAVAVVAAPPTAADASAPVQKAEGIGLAHAGNPFDIPDFSLAQVASILREAGGTHYRAHLTLNETVPYISSATLARLRLAAADPAVLEAMTEELYRDGRWERMDGLVQTFTQSGIRLILVAGAGYRKEAPLYTAPDGTEQPVSPDRIGRETYITMARWIAGAGVRRYGRRVQFWQVENEINLARLVCINGWRVNEGSWGDEAFLKRLLAELSATVHAEGKRAGLSLKTTHNFATGLPFWEKWVDSGDLDIVGIDMYANYFEGFPICKSCLVSVIRKAVAVAGGRPVWILETGYPQAPAIRGFTPDRQAEYFQDVFDAAYSNGVKVALAFGWFYDPKGWFTDGPNPPAWWSLEACEAHWGPPISVENKPDGSMDVRYGPAWDVLKDAARRWVAP